MPPYVLMTLNDLKLRARALLRPNRVEQELEEELAFHIEREARKLIDEGMTPAEARQRAQAHFGSTTLAADRCRDERGTAVIDNTIRDVQYALRAFAKAPLSAFTIVATVSIGLGVVAVLFTVLNTLLVRVDQVPDIGQMYAVERTQAANGGHTRQREFLPGRSRQSGHGPRVHAGRRCACGRQRGDRAEPQGVGSAFQS